MTGEHDHNDLATEASRIRIDADVAALTKRVAALEAAVKALQPTVPPVVAPSLFRWGVGLVQGDYFATDYANAGLCPVAALHMVAFGGNDTGSDVIARAQKFPAGTPLILHAAIAPSDLSVSGKTYDATTRLKSTAAAVTFAQRVADVVNAVPGIFAVTFTNEWKGYYGAATPGGWDGPTFVAHYIVFAQELRRLTTRKVELWGPYTDGGATEAAQVYRHQTFIDGVVKPHPDLVDAICWDQGDGVSGTVNHKWYTDFYRTRGVNLRHWDVEWYPGGHGPGTVADVAVVSQLRAMAANPLMAGALLWGPGPRPNVVNSEANQKALLWDSTGKTMPLFATLRGLTFP